MKHLSLLFLTAWLVFLSSCAHTEIAEKDVTEVEQLDTEFEKPSPSATPKRPNTAGVEVDQKNNDREEIAPPPPGFRDPDDLTELLR